MELELVSSEVIVDMDTGGVHDSPGMGRLSRVGNDCRWCGGPTEIRLDRRNASWGQGRGRLGPELCDQMAARMSISVTN